MLGINKKETRLPLSGALFDPPSPTNKASLAALQALVSQNNILAALTALHAEMGDVFRITLPGFKPIFLVGPEANRFVLATGQHDLRWRADDDPVTLLLRQGILVEDGEVHDRLRQAMNPAFHRQMLVKYMEAMVTCTDQVCMAWGPDETRDMLAEMRRITLLILTKTLFGVDFKPELDRLWPAILRTLKYISPGPWLIWPGIPRPGYKRARRQVDEYLFQIIQARRAMPGVPDDLLGLLVTIPGLSDDLIRDQLLTMLIAGHDTSTALLAWTLYLLGQNPAIMARLQAEIDTTFGLAPPAFADIHRLKYLDQVIKESLRLYPPIHLGQRIAAADLTFQNYHIPAGTRVLYSIYLSHRQPNYWPEPERFDPERFSRAQTQSRPAHTFVPFGGGPRNCIGAAFGLVEAKVVLIRMLQEFTLQLTQTHVHPHMGATLEPRPGVMMRVQRRTNK